MSPSQTAAFAGASGRGPAEILVVIALVFATALLMWLAVLTLNLFRSWQAGESDAGEFFLYLLRGAMLASVLLYIVR